jgi:hypothetical protein
MHTRPLTEKTMRALTCLAALLVLFLLPGCGGGGGGSTTPAPVGPAANVNASINWAARSRALDAPSSALSATIILKNANPAGGDFTYTINRDPNPAAYTRSYTSPRQALTGTRELQVRFYSQPDGSGSVVGSIDATITLGADGNGIGSFTTSNTIASVVVDPNQVVGLGQTKDLTFSARDSSNALVAVTPGSATFTVTSGGGFLNINSTQQAVGVAIGTAMVKVKVDGKTSDPQSVAVNYVPTIKITPSASSIQINGSLAVATTITSAPTSDMIFSVQEGADGGTFTGGRYIAPGTPGTYHLVAVSRYDTSISAVAAITVTPVSSNSTGFYILDSSNFRVVHMDDASGTNWQALGVGGAGVRQFNQPSNMVVTADGHIYIADTGNNRIVRMDDMSGKNWTTFGTFGAFPGQFRKPTSVAVGPDNKIYVTDFDNSRIVRVDDMAGANWTTYGSNGSSVGRFDGPNSINVASNGQIYVVDARNQRLVRIDDMNGTNWMELDGVNIRNITLGGDGRIYGTSSNGIFRMDDISGANGRSFSGINNSDGQLTSTARVILGTDSRIYILGSWNFNVNTFGIIRIDDMLGTNWKTFAFSSGEGVGQFRNPTDFIIR